MYIRLHNPGSSSNYTMQLLLLASFIKGRLADPYPRASQAKCSIGVGVGFQNNGGATTWQYSDESLILFSPASARADFAFTRYSDIDSSHCRWEVHKSQATATPSQVAVCANCTANSPHNQGCCDQDALLQVCIPNQESN